MSATATITELLSFVDEETVIPMPVVVRVGILGPNTSGVMELVGALSSATTKDGKPKLQRAWYKWETKGAQARSVDGLDIHFVLKLDGTTTHTEPRSELSKGRVVKVKGETQYDANGNAKRAGGGNPMARHYARVTINGQPYQFEGIVSDVLEKADEVGHKFFLSAKLFPVAQKRHHAIPEFDGTGISFG